MRRMAPVLSREEVENLTPDELTELEGLLEIDEQMSSPLRYMLAASKEAQSHKHLEILDDVILAAIEHRLYIDGPGPQSVRNAEGLYVHPERGDEIVTIIEIDMPPRHGKSFYVSQHLTAWFRTVFPDKNVVACSYGDDLARDWGIAAQQVVRDNPQFGVEVDRKFEAAHDWRLKGHKGRMITAGVGGPITGKGFHLGIIDDPIKNQKEALSETTRLDHKNWWATTFFTRCEPLAVIVIMATRWHEDDLSGHLLDTMQGKVYSVSIPAIAWDSVNEDGISIDPETGIADLMGRKPGEALWPERYPTARLKLIKEAQGEQWFQAMYQGKPSIAEGNKFKRFAAKWTLKDGVYTLKHPDGRIQTIPENQCLRISAIDLAATENTDSDWSVFAVGDVTPDHYLIIRYVRRERITSDKHTFWFTTLYNAWHPRYTMTERKTYELTLVQNLRRLGRYVMRKTHSVGDKVAKAHPAVERFGDDRVFTPENADWYPIWEREHKAFNNAKHDDQVDTTWMLVEAFDELSSWTPHIPQDDSLSARIDRYVDGQGDEKHDHPELGFQY
jgi:predicted phage terminase large subunit-like protein